MNHYVRKYKRAPREDSDQPLHQRSLIGTISVLQYAENPEVLLEDNEGLNHENIPV